MNALRFIFGATIALTAAVFAAMNLEPVNVTYSPLHDPIALPLYVIVLSAFAGGFILGLITLWLNDAPRRKKLRRQARDMKALEKKIETANDSEKSAAPPSDFFPALPKMKKKG